MKMVYIFKMNDQAPITIAEEFNSDRGRIISKIRENFIFVYQNGGSEKYTYEKLADLIKGVISESKISKKEVKSFLDSDIHFPRMDIEKVVALLELSIRLRDEVEPHIQKAKKLIKESRTSWDNPLEP